MFCPKAGMKKVLITGIEGFVGYYLTTHLLKRGYEIFGFHLLPVLQPLSEVRYFQCDILDFNRLKLLLKEIKPEGIFHLAALSSVSYSFAHPEDTILVNFIGTYNLLRAILLSSLSPRIVLISSADVYGRIKEKKPIKEESPLNPISPYGISKVLAEECGRIFWRAKSLEIVLLRPFNHIGIGQREDFVFSYCAKRITEIEKRIKRNPLVLGNIDVQRDYLDVWDVVNAYERAFRLGKAGEVYNIATGKPMRIRDGVNFLISLAKKPIRIAVRKERKRKYDIPYLSGDPKKFQRGTGWQPERDIKMTLTGLLNYYREKI